MKTDDHPGEFWVSPAICGYTAIEVTKCMHCQLCPQPPVPATLTCIGVDRERGIITYESHNPRKR